MPPPIYTNNDGSSYKYSKHCDKIYMGFMRNYETVTYFYVCPFDNFQHISSCHAVEIDQY